MFARDPLTEVPALRPNILVCHDFLAPIDHDRLFDWCRAAVPWRQTTVSFGGKPVAVPRELAWYGDTDYTYTGIVHRAEPMPQPLLELADRIEAWMEKQGEPATFNSLLLNHYRDGNDSIGMHADEERQLGPKPLIASISLGATCRFRFQHKATGLRLVEPLLGGGLLMMTGDCQSLWRHGIDEELGRGPRVNLTFRLTHSK